jgi:hypothetical protein
VWAALSLVGSRGGPAWPEAAHPAVLPTVPRPGPAGAAGGQDGRQGGAGG